MIKKYTNLKKVYTIVRIYILYFRSIETIRRKDKENHKEIQNQKNAEYTRQ